MALSVTKPVSPAFKQFDVVSDHSDHHYSYVNMQGQGMNNSNEDVKYLINSGSTVYKKIMREWKILENGLPDTIYVRGYETRVDLMRAVIVGAAGTPYHEGLFFFDIKFPPDYPNHPPQVHYRSHGLTINPYIGPKGHICLSLLNTWIGWGKERWVPSQSTILQVLVSIQALVFNEKPCFNEIGVGFLDWISGVDVMHNPYNEKVFITTCQSMLYLLRNPPKNFEAFVVEYFRQRASHILRACFAYANGHAVVGYYNNEIEAKNKSRRHFVCEMFKGSMEKLYPLLVQAFKKNGISTEHWVEEELIVERKPAMPFSWRKLYLVCCCIPWANDDDDDRDRDVSLLKNKGELN